jgi:hypothetical protein
MRMHIDETWSNDAIGRIHVFISRHVRKITDRDDTLTAQCNIGSKGRTAAAVHHFSTTDNAIRPSAIVAFCLHPRVLLP